MQTGNSAESSHTVEPIICSQPRQASEWAGLQGCREKYRQTIVPLRYILPAVHTAAGLSPWWNVTLIHTYIFDARESNVTLLLRVGGVSESLPGWHGMRVGVGDAVALWRNQRGSVQQPFSSAEAFRLLFTKTLFFSFRDDFVDFDRKLLDNIRR